MDKIKGEQKMKYCILGDTHLGASNADEFHANNQRQFFKYLYKTLENIGVYNIIQTGDFFDDRKHIKHPTIQLANELINDKFKYHIIIGNHDMYYKNSITPNSVNEVLSKFDNITVYNKMGSIDGIDLVPWICDENHDSIMSSIKASKNKYCIGHFELIGFDYYKNNTATHGYERDFLNNYERVFSGHYHTRSENKNITYVGTPYTLNTNDANDIRGFYIFDSDTGAYEFIENPVIHHVRYNVDDNIPTGNRNVNLIVDALDTVDKKEISAIIEQHTKTYNNVNVKIKKHDAVNESRVEYNQNISISDIMYEHVDKDTTLLKSDKESIKMLLREYEAQL